MSKNMSQFAIQRRKRSLSAHQKQMRFFTGLAVMACSLVAAVFFWYLSRPGFVIH